MGLFDTESAPARAQRCPVPLSDLDHALTAQIVVAWAGESGEEKRLGWWRTDLVSEFGGEDLFRRLLPHTWPWAVLQGAREAARRKDAELRQKAHDPDRLLSLYSLGFELDERLEERFLDLERAGHRPAEALPGLAQGIAQRWSRDAFLTWIGRHGIAEWVPAPAGRRLTGDPPSDLPALVGRLVGGLTPLADTYPLPHFQRPA